MIWRISSIFVATLLMCGYISCQKHDTLFSHSKAPMGRESGSGGWALNFSDDEDLMDSGSGSGSGFGDVEIEVDKNRSPVITKTSGSSRTTDHPLSECEKMRHNSRLLQGKKAPRCLPNGDYDSLQCQGYPGTSECWCSDLQGREITGTLMEAPNYPSCDDGNNLPPCVHQLVRHIRGKLLGGFLPKCASDGQFKSVQCHGSVCFCVEKATGNKVSGTDVLIPDKPNCGDDDLTPYDGSEDSVRKPYVKETGEGSIDLDDLDQPRRHSTTEVNQRVDQDVDKSEESKKGDDKFGEDNKTDKKEDEKVKSTKGEAQEDKVEKASDIMTQPGPLAGIIGGSVVLLLCLVLLAMFIVYRMRKKDEGSYPLDEPRKTPNYSYVRAPEKEFYA